MELKLCDLARNRKSCNRRERKTGLILNTIGGKGKISEKGDIHHHRSDTRIDYFFFAMSSLALRTNFTAVHLQSFSETNSYGNHLSRESRNWDYIDRTPPACLHYHPIKIPSTKKHKRQKMNTSCHQRGQIRHEDNVDNISTPKRNYSHYSKRG